MNGLSVNNMGKTVTKTTSTKKVELPKWEPELITRVCKVLDANIIEYLPQDSGEYKQQIFVIFQDIHDSTALRLALNPDDIEKIVGSALSSKQMIELCIQFRSVTDNFEFLLYEDVREITVEHLLGHPQKNVDAPQTTIFDDVYEDEEEDIMNDDEEIVLNDENITTLRVKKNFGKKYAKNKN